MPSIKQAAEEMLLQTIIPFWKGMRDEENGGFYGYMDFDLKLDKKAEKGCILNSRILWFFSEAAMLTGRADLAEVERIYSKEENKTIVIIDTPKSMTSIRTIPINSKLYNILKQVKRKCTKNDFVLTGLSDHYVEPRNYQYNFKEILKKSKIKRYKFHTLRHTFATNCIEAGMDIKSLSEILGHADVSITLNIYVHSSDKTKRKYLEKI